MVSINGSIKIEFSDTELEVLLSMVEGSIFDCLDDGDDPSETARNVWRKVAMLCGVSEVRCQDPPPRGGDCFDARVLDYERAEEERNSALKEYDRSGLDFGRIR